MSTLIFIVSCFALLLILMSRLPGLEHLVRPMIGGLVAALTVCLTNLTAWCIYIVKTLAYSHIEFARHLLRRAQTIDPTATFTQEFHDGRRSDS